MKLITHLHLVSKLRLHTFILLVLVLVLLLLLSSSSSSSSSSSPWTTPLGLGLLCVVPRSHSDTPHSVGLHWTSDRPVEEIFNWHSTTLTRNRHPCLRRDSNPLSQQASSRRLTSATGIGALLPVFHSNTHVAVSN